MGQSDQNERRNQQHPSAQYHDKRYDFFQNRFPHRDADPVAAGEESESEHHLLALTSGTVFL